jgi:hypothetical protein
MPGQVDLNDIYRSIGTLSEAVTGLRRDLQESEQAARATSQRADEHRSVLHKRMDEIVHRTGAIEGDVKNLNRTVAEVKEVTDEVTRWKIAGMGALGITGLAAGAIASIVTAYWSDILRMVRGS